jgi:Putative Ig domain
MYQLRKRRSPRRLLSTACALLTGVGAATVIPVAAGPVHAAGLEEVPLEAPIAGHVVLGELASRSQRNPVSIAGIGPYTMTGIDSITGEPYTFVTDKNYSASLDAYTRESDERALSGGMFTSSNAAAERLGRTDVLQLTSNTNCLGGNTFDELTTYCSAYGPQVYSEPFEATVGQAVTFDWSAEGTEDDYEIYAFLVEVQETEPDVFDYGTPADHTLLAYGRGEDQGWTTASGDVPNTGTYRFRFVNGSYDATGGYALGSNMYIDSVVKVGTANPITFAPLGDRIVGDAPFELTATAPAGAVTFTSLTTDKCTVSGTTVTLVAAQTGVCTIVADQAGDGVDYVPAQSVAQSFTILAAATAPTNSGLPLIFGTPGPGATVTMTEGTWADGGSPITGTDIEWLQTVGATTTEVTGADASECVLLPLAGSTLTVQVTKTNAIGSTSASSAEIADYTCGTPTAPSWTDDEIGPLQAGEAFVDGVVAAGAPPASYAVTAGTLPDGLSLDPATGAITGTPTVAGAYSFTITASNGVGPDVSVVLSGTIAQGELDGDGFTSVIPERVLDTRVDGAKVEAGSTYVLPVDETWDVDADASSFVVNVTVTEPDALGFVTVFPCGGETPTASTVNYAAGETVANVALVAPGDDDAICVYTLATTHLVIDLNGYHSPASDARLVASVPSRLLDTRESVKPVSGQEIEIDVIGDDFAPVGTESVVLNVAVTDADGVGFVTVYPCGTPRPLASNVNYSAGTTVANQVFARVGDDGKVCAYLLTGADLVVDFNGAFSDESSAAFSPMVPERVLDTRDDQAATAGEIVELDLATGEYEDATAFALNVTATDPTGDGFLTVFPCGDVPMASNVNYLTGDTAANHVTAAVDDDGRVCIFTLAAVHIVVDVQGVYS